MKYCIGGFTAITMKHSKINLVRLIHLGHGNPNTRQQSLVRQDGVYVKVFCTATLHICIFVQRTLWRIEKPTS